MKRIRRRGVVGVGSLAAVVVAVVGLSACGGGAGNMYGPAAIPATAAGPVRIPGSGWPALLDGPSHYGAAAVKGPTVARVVWTRSLGAAIVPGPVVTAGGVAYVASDAGVLHAIDVDTGRDRWTFDGGAGTYANDLSTAPLVLGDGLVVWPGPSDALFGLSGQGTHLWTLAGDGGLLTPVYDQAAHVLIVADQSGQIAGYRVRPGALAPVRVWSRVLPRPSLGNPVVAADGTIYATAGDDLLALAPSGQVRWTVRTRKLVEVSPAVADGGVVVFGSDDRDEYGVDPDGRVRWRVAIGNLTFSSPLALPGDRVIFGNHSGQMNVLDSNTGRRVGRDAGRGELWTAAAVDDRGDAYFASRTGQIFGFGPTGRRLFDYDAGGKFDSYPALAPDGTLLIGSDTGILYAIR